MNRIELTKQRNAKNEDNLEKQASKEKYIEEKNVSNNKKQYTFKRTFLLDTSWEVLNNLITDGVPQDDTQYKTLDVELGNIDIRMLPFIKVDFLLRNPAGTWDDEEVFVSPSFNYFFEVLDNYNVSYIKPAILKIGIYFSESVWTTYEAKINVSINNPYLFI